MNIKLQPATRAVARHLLGGWNSESTALQLGMSDAAVRQHRVRIRKAVGVTNCTLAILRILRDAKAMTHVFGVENAA